MLESVEISELISPIVPDVLHWNGKTMAYEITPSFQIAKLLRESGFKNVGLVYYTHWLDTVLQFPEWELLADPDTYARLKTNG